MDLRDFLKKDDVFTTSIFDIDDRGRGIGKVLEGAICFVPDARLGELVKIKLEKVKKGFCEGRILETLEKSPIIDYQYCPYLQRGCGGCSLGGVNYEEQLMLKKWKILNAIRRIGAVKLEDIQKELIIQESPVTTNYRNKVTFFVDNGNVGFKGRGSSNVIDCASCKLLEPVVATGYNAIRDFFKTNSDVGMLVKSVMIRKSVYLNENNDVLEEGILVKLTFHKGVRDSEFPWNIFAAKIDEKATLFSLYGNEHIAGDRVTYHHLSNGRRLEILPESFYQINDKVAKLLYDEVGTILMSVIDEVDDTEEKYINASLLKSADKTLILDLYCGCGSIGLAVGSNTLNVRGIELNHDAFLSANRNAMLNGLVSYQYLEGACENKIEEILKENIWQKKVAIVDPPRAGCDHRLLEAMVDNRIDHIIYVSCDPATLARDIRLLGEMGYRIVKVKAFDMFPQTVEVETVVLLSKLNVDKHISVEVELDELDLISGESKAIYTQIKEYV